MTERGKKRFCAYCGQSLDEYCDCDGLDASIYGDNGTGKTTLKNFKGIKDFEISLLRELALAEEGMTEELETDPLTQYGWYQQDLIDWRRSER